jgi:hypothetical protein
MQRPEAERAAHRYADYGWRVFPIAPGTKMPLIPSAHATGESRCTGECGYEGHGLHDATLDHKRIERWFETQPRANVAIRTGAPGPDVLDVDKKPGGEGYTALKKLQAAGLFPQPMAYIRTPSGGAHFYYRGTDQGNSSLRKSFVDYRGANGYAVAPPSTVDGRPYKVLNKQPSRETFDFAAARQLLEPEPERPRWVPSVGQEGQHTHEGLLRLVGDSTDHVNDKLFYAACRVIEQGDDHLLPALIEKAYAAGEDRRGQPERTVQSALRTARPFERATEREAG